MKAGIDIVKISRIKNILDKNIESFCRKIFTEKELEYVENKNKNPRTISGLFACKEAVSKLLGTGIGTIGWKDIEILHTNKDKPYVSSNPIINSQLNLLYLNSIEVSISHEDEYAIAIAIAFGYREEIKFQVPDEIKEILPKREAKSHKGTYGRVGIIAGSKGMTGAAYLSSTAAIRSGAGLVYSIVPDEIADIMAIKLTEVIIKSYQNNNECLELFSGFDGLALGPGLGVDVNKRQLVKSILKRFEGPIVLDADGINAINDYRILSNRNAPTVITPHPGELARLLDKDIKEIQENRIYYSKYTSDKYNVITVLKGNETIVSYGDMIYKNYTGNPGMATAGSGDVLTGMIISFICQGIDVYKACKLATYCHGLAGDIAKDKKGEYGLLASDILENIPKAIKLIQY